MLSIVGQVEIVPIDSVSPWPGNPRQGDTGMVAVSLEAHGQYRPLVVQTSSSRIVAGNHTWAAAKSLGWTEVAITRIDVDDEEAERILLVDNRTSDLATWDDHVLVEILSVMAASEQGLAGTGFDGDDLDGLIADLSTASVKSEAKGQPEAKAVECPECGARFVPA